MALTAPYRQHHYMGEYVDDAACLAFIQANKWDSTGNGSGNPRPGIQYFNTTSNKMRVYNGTAWVDFAGSIDVDTNYYVDGTDGNDSNDGLSWGAAKKTFGFLIDGETDSIPKCINADVVVYFKNSIRARNSKGNLKLEDFYGSGSLTIEGVLTEEETFTVSGYDNNQSNQDALFWVSDSTKSWTTNEWRRHFVEIDSRFFPVFSNTGTRLNLAMGRSLLGTPAGKIYSAPEILKELVTNPGVKYDFDYYFAFSVIDCDLQINIKNAWVDEEIRDISYNFNKKVHLWNISTAGISLSKSSLHINNSYFNTNSWTGVGLFSNSDFQMYNSSVHCTDSRGYGVFSESSSYGFLAICHISGQAQGCSSWEGSSLGIQRRNYIKDCYEAISISGSSVSFFYADSVNLRIDNCQSGIVGTGDIFYQENYSISVFNVNSEIVFGSEDVDYFSNLNSKSLKSRTNLIVHYVDENYITISKNEYNNTTSGLDAHNYQDAIDELAGDISGLAPDSASYWTSTAEAGLSAEINLGALSSGILKHTVSGGVSTPSIATAGTDYENALTFQHSLTRTTNTINLVGDSATPGNSKYYGTNSGGTKGFYDLPAASTPAGSTGQVQFNNNSVFGGTSQLYWDSGNNGLAYGKSTVDGARVDVITVEGTYAYQGTIYGPDPAYGCFLSLRKSRGSFGSEATVANGDKIGGVSFLGRGSTAYATVAAVQAVVDGTVSGNNIPTRLELQTHDGTTFTTRVMVTPAGRVGIGTTSLPDLGGNGTRKFVVSGDFGSTGMGLEAAGEGARSEFYRANGTLALKTVVANNDILGSINFSGLDNATTPVYVGATQIRGEVDGTVSSGVVPGRLYFATRNTSGTMAERLRITSNGEVLIGTTSGLNIVGAVQKFPLVVYGADSNPYFAGIISETSASTPRFAGYRHNGTLASKTAVVSGDVLNTIIGGGWDGGTTPTYVAAAMIQLTVDGTVSEDIIPGRIVFQTKNTSGTFVERMRITSAGGVGIGVTSLDTNYLLQLPNSSTQKAKAYAWDTYACSEVWKTNIVPIPNSLDKINSLRGITFSYNYPEENHPMNGLEGIGITAEELESLGLPNLVTKDNGTYTSINLPGIIPVLVEAIKELKTRLEILENSGG